MFNRIIESLKYKINRLFKSNIHTFISAIDLMQPVNGVFTAAQFTAVSRMLDIENIRAGGRSEWDVRFANLRQDYSEEENESFRKQTEAIVESMDKYGWDYNISSIAVNISPFYAYNGTHRLAFSLLKNPFQVVPICLDYDGWNWSIEDGVKRYSEKGISPHEIEVIEKRYKQLLNDNTYPYKILLSLNEYERIKKEIYDKINEIGVMLSVETRQIFTPIIPTWFTKKEQDFIKGQCNSTIVIISFTTLKKNLSFIKGEFRSQTFEDIIESLDIERYSYTPTITKSIEMDIWLKENSRLLN